jgi:hypothetical protein
VAMPLSEGEMWVSFVFEPEYPAEGDIIPIHVQMQRSLLSSEESARSIIPRVGNLTYNMRTRHVKFGLEFGLNGFGL